MNVCKMFSFCWDMYQSISERDRSRAEEKEWWLGGMLAAYGTFESAGGVGGTADRLANEIFDKYKDKSPLWVEKVTKGSDTK